MALFDILQRCELPVTHHLEQQQTHKGIMYQNLASDMFQVSESGQQYAQDIAVPSLRVPHAP
jgi:hypothetical protein